MTPDHRHHTVSDHSVGSSIHGGMVMRHLRSVALIAALAIVATPAPASAEPSVPAQTKMMPLTAVDSMPSIDSVAILTHRFVIDSLAERAQFVIVADTATVQTSTVSAVSAIEASPIASNVISRAHR